MELFFESLENNGGKKENLLVTRFTHCPTVFSAFSKTFNEPH